MEDYLKVEGSSPSSSVFLIFFLLEEMKRVFHFLRCIRALFHLEVTGTAIEALNQAGRVGLDAVFVLPEPIPKTSGEIPIYCRPSHHTHVDTRNSGKVEHQHGAPPMPLYGPK